MKENNLSISEKYSLTLEESAQYFNIGLNRLRDFIKERRDADFLLWVGTKCLIKRKMFENMLDKINAI